MFQIFDFKQLVFYLTLSWENNIRLSYLCLSCHLDHWNWPNPTASATTAPASGHFLNYAILMPSVAFQLSSWLVQIGQATLRNRGDLGIDVYTAKDFVELHERLAKDLTVNNTSHL